MRFAPLAPLAIVAALATPALAQTDTSFTYQGRLLNAGVPYTGPADIIVNLCADPTGPSQISSTPSQVVAVQNGVFTMTLDFGSDFFGAAPRYLEFLVRAPAGSGPYTFLGQRQPLTRVPYSIQTRGIRVSTDGQLVGIGTASPSFRLDVQSSEGALLNLLSYSTTSSLLNLQNVGGGTAWRFESTGSAHPFGAGKLIFTDEVGGTFPPVLTLTDTSRLGINNPNPAVRLHAIRGSDTTEVARFADAGDNSQLRLIATSFTGQIQSWNGSLDQPAALYLNPAGGRIGVNIASGATGTLDVAGSIRARGGDPGPTGVNQNGYAFRAPGDNDSGLFSLGDGQASIFVNAVEAVRFTPGNTNVVGNINLTSVSGTINFPDGTSISSNRVVATRASAVVDFPSIGVGGRAAVNVAVPGALPGDIVLYSAAGTDFPFPLIPIGSSCAVANQVRILAQNVSGAAVDAPAFNVSIIVIRP